jgi:hypothetical protein
MYNIILFAAGIFTLKNQKYQFRMERIHRIIERKIESRSDQRTYGYEHRITVFHCRWSWLTQPNVCVFAHFCAAG